MRLKRVTLFLAIFYFFIFGQAYALESLVLDNGLEVFIEENQKILDFYEKQGKLVKIDARGNKDDVFQRIKKKFG